MNPRGEVKAGEIADRGLAALEHLERLLLEGPVHLGSVGEEVERPGERVGRGLVAEREVVGGQAGASVLIRNYLGFPRSISGGALIERAYQQAWLFGARYVFAREVTGLHRRHRDRVVSLSDGREVTARAVLIATGARYRRLDAPGVESFVGAGVFYTSPSDPALFAGHDVVVAGGGNSAGQAVLHLARYARRVLLLVRGDDLARKMSDYLVQAIRHAENVEVRLSTEIVRAHGGHQLEAITVREARGALEDVPTGLLRVLVGVLPHSGWLAGAVECDAGGFVLTGDDVTDADGRRARQLETSMPGVFAAGDVRHGSVKRVASAVGEGAVAVRPRARVPERGRGRRRDAHGLGRAFARRPDRRRLSAEAQPTAGRPRRGAYPRSSEAGSWSISCTRGYRRCSCC